MKIRQTIFRRAHTAAYVTVANTLARDEALSHQARGILLWLLSYPVDWDVKIGALVTPKNKIASVRAAVQELEDEGYVYRTRERDAAGRLGPTLFMVYEEPLTADKRSGSERRNKPRTENRNVEPHTENQHVDKREKAPHTDLPHVENRTLQKTERTQKTETTTTAVVAVGTEPLPERPTVFAEYERQFGMMLTPGIADMLKDMTAEYSDDWVRDALSITATSGKRGNLRYTEGILRRWKVEGREPEKSAGATITVDEKTAWRAAQKARPNVAYDAALDMLLPAFNDEDDRRRYITDYLKLAYVPTAEEELP